MGPFVAATFSGSEEVARRTADYTHRGCPVRATGEVVQHGFAAGSIYLVDGTGAPGAAIGSGPIEVARLVSDHAGRRIRAL